MTRTELFWRNVWLAIRRSRRDKRALRMLVVLLGVLGYGAYLVKTALYLGWGGTAFEVLILSLATGLGVLMRRSYARSDESMISLTTRVQTAQEDLSGHRARLAQELLKTAILVDRAGAESLVRSGLAEAAHQGVCRRRTLDLARAPAVWEGLTEEERDLLLSQEGSWAWEQVWPRILRVEDVRVLRWVLGLDPVLLPFHFLKPDLKPALEITVRPEVLVGDHCMAAWELGGEETAAQVMLQRCIGEGILRGNLTETDQELRDAYVGLAERLGGDESQDLLIGNETVSRVQEDRLQWASQAALRRVVTFGWVKKYLEGEMAGVVGEHPDSMLEHL